MQHPKQALDLGAANSLPTAVGRAIAPSRMGHIVSTGNPLPQIMQMANKQARARTLDGLSHPVTQSEKLQPARIAKSWIANASCNLMPDHIARVIFLYTPSALLASHSSSVVPSS